jgi:hypothetical protein
LATSKGSSCIYSNGSNTNGNCNTQCSVPVNGSWNDTGSVTGFCHQTSKVFSPGSASAVGDGASCTGAVGGAVKECFSCLCGVSISLSVAGFAVSVSSDGFFTTEDHRSLICAAQVQPDPNACPPPPDQQLTDSSDGSSSADASCEPLIVDVSGNGFSLTDTAHGVVFDIRADGRPFQIPWTTDAQNAFLVLDRNGNGVIDNGSELFGNRTPQSQSPNPNGFLALAQYDKPENGGNGDGVIDSRDAIFSQLRLWVDANHDGVSQPEELHTLPEMGVFSIGLDYLLSRRTDEFGNVFRYRAKINQGARGATEAGKQIYDVFFVSK